FLAGLAAFFCAENNFRTKEADKSEKLADFAQLMKRSRGGASARFDGGAIFLFFDKLRMQHLVDPAFEGGTPVVQTVDLPGKVDKYRPEGLCAFAGAEVVLNLPELLVDRFQFSNHVRQLLRCLQCPVARRDQSRQLIPDVG